MVTPLTGPSVAYGRNGTGCWPRPGRGGTWSASIRYPVPSSRSPGGTWGNPSSRRSSSSALSASESPSSLRVEIVGEDGKPFRSLRHLPFWLVGKLENLCPRLREQLRVRLAWSVGDVEDTVLFVALGLLVVRPESLPVVNDGVNQ